VLHLKDLVIAQVLCLQHIRDGQEVLHLRDLGVDITTEELRFFLLDAGLAKDASLGDDEMDGKAAASCRTPNKKRQPRLPLFASSRTLTRDDYTTRARTDSENHPGDKILPKPEITRSS
jgi:hypothetical protein